MEYYPHHIGDYLAATGHLTPMESYCYIRLMWLYYDLEEPLPDDRNRLARRIGVDPGTTYSILEEFFELEDGAWHHERIDGEIAKFHKKVEAAAKAGRASARARRKKRNDRATSVERPLKSVQPPNTQDPIPNTVQDKPERAKRFTPPTLDELTAYFEEKDLAGIPYAMFDHFESNGWKVGGKAPMKDWKAAARNWSRRELERNQGEDTGFARGI